MKKFYVYIHTCPNGKKYVGLTTADPKDRWMRGNGYKSNKHFYRAIQKYGWDNIDHQVIEVDTENEMYYLEKYLIAYYQTNNSDFGYNKSIGGEGGNTGYHYSEEIKHKMSESHKGVKKGPHSEETRKKISEAKKGNQYHKGKHHSAETKHKMSEIKKGVKRGPHSEETKKKISESQKGVKRGPHSEETKAKMKGRIPWNKGLKKELV